MGPLDAPVLLSGGLNPASLLGGTANGFYFDFTRGPTGGTIASITSDPPSAVVASQATSSHRPPWQPAAAGYTEYDGLDNSLGTNLTPGAEMTMAACFRATASCVLAGSSDGSANRSACLAVSVGGTLGAAWRGQGTATIMDGVAVTDLDVVALFRGSAARANLWRNGASVYDQAASGSANTTVSPAIGAINANGTPGSHLNGRIYRIFSVNRFLDDNEIGPLMRALSAGIVSY